jgi:hypothetical protein
LLAVALAGAYGAATTNAAEPQTVSVSLSEYAISMPARLRPGPTTFVIRNHGVFPHNFTLIYGPRRFRSGTVRPGATKRLETMLVPGAYVVGCTILDGGHIARGMFTVFTIGTRADGSAHWHFP